MRCVKGNFLPEPFSMQPLQGPSDPLLTVLSPKRCQMTRSAAVMHQFNASTLEISSIYSSVYTVLHHFCGSSANLPGKHCIQHLLRVTTVLLNHLLQKKHRSRTSILDEPHVHLLILHTFRLEGLRPNKLSCASVPKKIEYSNLSISKRMQC